MKYRRKSVEVEAWQWLGGNANFDARPQWVKDSVSMVVWHTHIDKLTIKTPDAHMWMLLDVGDWIIRGSFGGGDLYSCKANFFAETYEPCLTSPKQAQIEADLDRAAEYAVRGENLAFIATTCVSAKAYLTAARAGGHEVDAGQETDEAGRGTTPLPLPEDADPTGHKSARPSAENRDSLDASTPTQAQIEAAAKAIARGRINPLSVSAEGENPENGWEYQMPLAEAALTAAAKIKEPTECIHGVSLTDDCGPCIESYGNNRPIAAATIRKLKDVS